MLVIGRITADAVVNTLKDERQVVNFSIAVNDFYKPKEQPKQRSLQPTLIALIGSAAKL